MASRSARCLRGDQEAILAFTFPSGTGLVLIVPALSIWVVLMALDFYDRRKNPDRYDDS